MDLGIRLLTTRLRFDLSALFGSNSLLTLRRNVLRSCGISVGGRGGFRGGRGGFRGGSRGGRGGGRGDYNRRDEGPPDYVNEVGAVSHPCEDQLVCRCTYEGGRVPYFNAGIYLENKQLVGKVDEILGPITDFFFSVKLAPNMNASSFKKLQKLFIDPQKTLPLEMFTNPSKGGRGRGRGRLV
ncbi:GAR1 [Bugula neritina]|uniref:H/ACA ribonucleoprotein complex subunit n=1 Tax=Bugula neritina TaxID=10212 RepID=A0A7J7IWL8_BUGNE|nr:GAR1 [Bugula neritina]